jgi:hypothetical protein
MRERLLSLAENRARLRERAQAERDQLAALLAPMDAAASVAASLYRAGQRVAGEARRYPLVAVAGVVLLVALRPRRALAWLARGWSLWRLYRGASGVWQRFAQSAGSAGAPPSRVR